MLTFNHGSPYFWHKVVLPKFISGCRMDLICGTSWLKRIYNPITAFWQCLPFSWTEIRGKHCRHPINVMGVVDTFEHGFISQKVKKLQEAESLPFCPTVAAFLLNSALYPHVSNTYILLIHTISKRKFQFQITVFKGRLHVKRHFAIEISRVKQRRYCSG